MDGTSSNDIIEPSQRRRSAQLIIAFVFATRIVQSLYFFNPKFQASSFLLSLYRTVCVRPGRKPRRPVFSRRSSYKVCIHQTSNISSEVQLNFEGSAFNFLHIIECYLKYIDPASIYQVLITIFPTKQFEPVREKTDNLGSDQVRHKPDCTVTEDGYRLEISDLKSKGIVLTV